MFNGEASVSFKTNKQMPDVIATVKDLLRSLGSVRINNRGTIEISPSEKYKTLLVDSTISGELTKGQATDEYTVRIDYKCLPSIANWVIAAAGTLFCLVGFILLGAPILVKSNLDKNVRRCLDEIEDSLQPREGMLK